MTIIRMAALLALGVLALGGPSAASTQTTAVASPSPASEQWSAAELPGEPGAAGPSSAATPPSYVLKTSKLASGKKATVRWNPCQKAITYRVNLQGLAKAKRPAMLKQIKAAFGRLSTADGITYRYAGVTTFIPKSGNVAKEPAEIVVATVSGKATDLGLTGAVLGVGGVMWSTWTVGSREGLVVIRGFVVLSPAGLNGLTPSFGRGGTQGNLILHELGHATGLEHVTPTNELMNPILTASAPNGYGPGDLAGLKRAGRKGGCVTVPSSVRVPDLS